MPEIIRCPVCGGPLPDSERDCSPDCRDARTGAPDRAQPAELGRHAPAEVGWLRVAALLTWDDVEGIDGDD